MQPKVRSRILCVDDEPNVVEALALHLGMKFDVKTATSGAAGLEVLSQWPDVAVVISDMRMPVMNGAAFLAKARAAVPDTVRLLLTGETDLNSAIAAVNEGQIFRFLTKPCSPASLLVTVSAAIEHHRLLTAERVLLEQTLQGSIKALTDVLALTNPTSFGHAIRIKRYVTEVATMLGMTDRWQIEVAAMLAPLGCISLPAETLEKLYYDRPLSEDEQAMLARVPAVTEQLLGSIPRLEPVREILAFYSKPQPPASNDPKQQHIEACARLLRVVTDFDALEGRGSSPELAIATLRSRSGKYDPKMLEALAVTRGANECREEIKELPIAGLRVGMIFAEDIRTKSGTLLVARGFEVTGSFIERAKNFRAGTVKEPMRVIVKTSTDGRTRAA